MKYPEWWERLVAAVIDGLILFVISFIISLILVGIAGLNLSLIRIMAFLAGIISLAIMIGYKVFFEGGSWQATPGKMVFGLKLVADGGKKPDLKSVIMRTWPWWIFIIPPLLALIGVGGTLITILFWLVMIGIFCTFFLAPVGRCLHDQTANLHVSKASEGMIKTATK